MKSVFPWQRRLREKDKVCKRKMKAGKMRASIICTMICTMAVMGMFLNACGQNDAETAQESENQQDDAETAQESENQRDDVETAQETESQQDDVETAQETESLPDAGQGAETEEKAADNREMPEANAGITFCDEVITPDYTDDVSVLEEYHQQNHNYAFWEDKVYFRKYSTDSYEEGALWGNYSLIDGTKTKIACVDGKGVVKELFTDEGDDDIYIINGRLYTSVYKEYERTGKDGGTYIQSEKCVYSVNLDGKDRVEYGYGYILAVDEEKNLLILHVREKIDGTPSLKVLNCDIGNVREIDGKGAAGFRVEEYADGWIYLSRRVEDEQGETGVLTLAALSLEGETKMLAEMPYFYEEYEEARKEITSFAIAGGRIIFTFGSFEGTGREYWSDKIGSVRLDGSGFTYRDCNLHRPCCYVWRNAERTLIISPETYYTKDGKRVSGKTGEPQEGWDDACITAWDADTGEIFPCDLDRYLLNQLTAFSGFFSRAYYTDLVEDREGGIVCLMPDASGRIVTVAENVAEYIGEAPKIEEEWRLRASYEDFYYHDGYLYFTVYYEAYSEKYSLGWRDGYERIVAEVYRLKLGEDKAQLLYAY